MKKTGKSPSERKDFAESVKSKRPAYFALLKMNGDSKKINTIIARAAKQAEKSPKSVKTHKQVVAEITEQNRRYYGCYGKQSSAATPRQRDKSVEELRIEEIQKQNLALYQAEQERLTAANLGEHIQTAVPIVPRAMEPKPTWTKQIRLNPETGKLQARDTSKGILNIIAEAEREREGKAATDSFMADNLSYICPHCNSEMTFAPVYKGMDSQCPHCQVGIILGQKPHRSRPIVNVSRAGAMVWGLGLFAALVCGVGLIAGLASAISSSNQAEKARLEALQNERDAIAKRDAEDEKYYAAMDAQIAKLKAEYNTKIGWDGWVAPVYRSGVPDVLRSQTAGQEPQHPMTAAEFQNRWDNMTEEQKQRAANHLGRATGTSAQEQYNLHQSIQDTELPDRLPLIR